MSAPLLHSYSFHGYPLDAFLDYAQSRQWASVELAGCHLGPSPSKAIECATRRGVHVETVGFYADVTCADAARRKQAIEDLLEMVGICAQLGVPRLNGFAGWLTAEGVPWQQWLRHGTRLATAQQRAWFVEGFSVVAAEAERREIQVMLEVHPNTLHDTATAAGDLLAAVGSPAVGLTLDPANSAMLDARDADPRSMPAQGFPLYFHFKNYLSIGDEASFDVDADQGLLDLRSWIRALHPHVAVCIEYPGNGDPDRRLQAARRYYQEIVTDLEVSRP